MFKSADLDSESKLWNLPLNEIAGTKCLLVKKLFQPLVVARETSSNKLWFLNYLMLILSQSLHGIFMATTFHGMFMALSMFHGISW